MRVFTFPGKRSTFLAVLLPASLALAGCKGFLPIAGPTPAITTPAKAEQTVPHVMVQLTPENAKIASLWVKEFDSLHSMRRAQRSPEIRFGVGDTVAVTIFEAASGGLFIPSEAGSRAGNFVTLPEQQIDRNGNIKVPYAGQVPAAGRRPSEVQQTIEERLRNRAIEPQAIVSLTTQQATQVSVLGAVKTPLRTPVNHAGTRVLDAIAQAGGPSGEGYESFVTLQRGSRKQTIFFQKLIDQPDNNIFVQPGDMIYLNVRPSAFTVLGAVSQNGKFNFEAAQVTLADAVGRAGGLLDERANAAAVYLYRQESREIARKLGVDVDAWPQGPIPIIYNVNMLADQSPFALREFQVRDGDVIYVANAPAVELTKFLVLLNLSVGAANAAYDLKIAR